jgi:hypothetical protein
VADSLGQLANLSLGKPEKDKVLVAISRAESITKGPFRGINSRFPGVKSDRNVLISKASMF